MENRNSEFGEGRIGEALNVMEDKAKMYLKENNMLEDFTDYPAEDLSRILFRQVFDLEEIVVIDYAIRTYDLTNVLEVRSLLGWVLEWPVFNYDDFECLLLNRISAEEKESLNETVSAGIKNKNAERI